MTKTGKIVAWVIVIVVIIGIIIGVSRNKKTDTTAVNKEPIKIGVIVPVTGDAAAYGEPINNGIKLAEKEINDAGGINGRQVQMIYEDGKCTGKDATTAAQKLISIDKVKFIVGGVCSSEVLGYAPVTNAAGVLTLTPGASNPSVSELGDYVFRTSTNDALRGVLIADYASKVGKKIALINEKTDYAQGLKDSFTQRANEIKLSIVANEEFASDIKDFRSILTKVKQSGADIIFLNAQTEANLLRLAQQARELGITAPFVSSEFNGPAVAAAGKSVEGMVVVVAPGLGNEGKAKILTDTYKATFGKDIAYPFYVGAAYDDVHLIVDGIKQVGEDPTKVKDYLYSLKDYNGTIGTFSFDKNGDMTGVSFVFQKIENGKFVDIK